MLFICTPDIWICSNIQGYIYIHGNSFNGDKGISELFIVARDAAIPVEYTPKQVHWHSTCQRSLFILADAISTPYYTVVYASCYCASTGYEPVREGVTFQRRCWLLTQYISNSLGLYCLFNAFSGEDYNSNASSFSSLRGKASVPCHFTDIDLHFIQQR